jgi:hypothetical protein
MNDMQTCRSTGPVWIRKAAWSKMLRSTLLAAPFLIAVPARAQGPDIHAPGDPTQQQLIELFGKVETRLREIDRLLSDAGAGDTRALEKVGPAGIDELLKQSRQNGEQALQDIDKILEIARQMGQRSQGQGQGQPGQQQGDGKDPLQGQGQTTSRREPTPSAPDPKEKEKKPGDGKQDGGQKPEDKPDKSKPDGQSNPKDPKASKQSPQNRESGPPPGSQQDKSGTSTDTRDRWGDLPQHARDVFRSEGGHDMPVQYRDWIDAYYRRLNQKQP